MLGWKKWTFLLYSVTLMHTVLAGQSSPSPSPMSNGVCSFNINNAPCTVDCTCFDFELISYTVNSAQATIVWEVADNCKWEVSYIAFGSAGLSIASPDDGSTYVGQHSTYTVVYTTMSGISMDDLITDHLGNPGFQSVKFQVKTQKDYHYGAKERFTIVLNQPLPADYKFSLQGHAAQVYDTFAGYSIDTCISQDNDSSCPPGYGGPGCADCANPADTPGWTYWCIPLGTTPMETYTLSLQNCNPAQSNCPSGGFSPYYTHVSPGGYQVNCNCDQQQIPCPNNCYGNGYCNYQNGTCNCNVGVPPYCSVSSPSATPSITPSPSPSISASGSSSSTPSRSASATPSGTPSRSSSVTPSSSPSITPSNSPTKSPSSTPSSSPTPSVSASNAPSGPPSPTPSNTPSNSMIPSPSITPSVSLSPSFTPSPSVTPSSSETPSPTSSASPSTSSSPSSLATSTPSSSPRTTPSPSAIITPSPETLPCEQYDFCSGRGLCEGASCNCTETGYLGTNCTEVPPAFNCSDYTDCTSCTYSSLNCSWCIGQFGNSQCVPKAECSPGNTTVSCNPTTVNYEPNPCQHGCNGHGKCDDGQCNCDPGWTGDDCGSFDSVTVGAAVGGAVIGLIVMGAVAFVLLAGGGAAYLKYSQMGPDKTADVKENPLYEGNEPTENPLYEESVELQ